MRGNSLLCKTLWLAGTGLGCSVLGAGGDPQEAAKAPEVNALTLCCETQTPTVASTTITPWLPPDARSLIFPKQIVFFDHTAKRLGFQDLVGEPLALSFFYTRCENPNKCPLVVATMSQLQREVEKQGLKGQVRLLLITYDPEYDRPEILYQYAVQQGLTDRSCVHLMQPEIDQKKVLFDALQIAVNFNAQGVNIHGIQLLLFDHQGRYVRSYHRVIWDNAKVIQDLKILCAEGER